MQRKELQDALHNLSKVGKYSGEKFRYAFTKNVGILKRAIKNVESLIQPAPEYVEYLRELEKLKLSHVERDENNNPKIDNGHYVMKDMNALTADVDTLKEKHKLTLDAFTAKQEKLKEFLEEEADIFIHMIKETDLPADITAEDYAGITFMIEEDVNVLTFPQKTPD